MKKTIGLLLFMVHPVVFLFCFYIFFLLCRPFIVVGMVLSIPFFIFAISVWIFDFSWGCRILDVILGLTQIYLLIKPMHVAIHAKYIQFVNIELLILVYVASRILCMDGRCY